MNYTLKIGQDYIKPKSSVQNLGVHIESNVYMDKQTSSIINLFNTDPRHWRGC